jgi:hypothetical protein
VRWRGRAQSARDAGEAEGGGAGGGEFDRQRQAVEAAADAGDRAQALPVAQALRVGRFGETQEHLHGAVSQNGVWQLAVVLGDVGGGTR